MVLLRRQINSVQALQSRVRIEISTFAVKMVPKVSSTIHILRLGNMLANKTFNEIEIVAFMYDVVLILSLFTIKLMFFFVTRETLLRYISEGDDVQAQGSLFVLATLLQTKGIGSGVVQIIFALSGGVVQIFFAFSDFDVLHFCVCRT